MDEEKEDEGEVDIPDAVPKKKRDITGKIRENPWILSTFVFGVLAVILVVTSFNGGLTGNVVSERNAGDYLVDYLSSVGYDGFEVENVESDGSVYLVETTFEGDDIPFYVTKTGYLIGNSLVSIIPSSDSSATGSSSNNQLVQDIPKSDVPEVELFIMTHCPYGTQAEKGILPVFELLDGKIDANIRFVHYFMHDPEEEETPRQVCIREEQEEKYYDYLKCFLEDGDADRCLTEVGVDKSKLSSCISSSSDGYYEEDSELSEGYGVRGSPTLVINREIVSSGRSPADYLDVVCQAFNEAPGECGEQLSTSGYSPGFGYEASGGSGTTAQC